MGQRARSEERKPGCVTIETRRGSPDTFHAAVPELLRREFLLRLLTTVPARIVRRLRTESANGARLLADRPGAGSTATAAARRRRARLPLLVPEQRQLLVQLANA